jgi:hypothetical protein
MNHSFQLGILLGLIFILWMLYLISTVEERVQSKRGDWFCPDYPRWLFVIDLFVPFLRWIRIFVVAAYESLSEAFEKDRV